MTQMHSNNLANVLCPSLPTAANRRRSLTTGPGRREGWNASAIRRDIGAVLPRPKPDAAHVMVTHTSTKKHTAQAAGKQAGWTAARDEQSFLV